MFDFFVLSYYSERNVKNSFDSVCFVYLLIFVLLKFSLPFIFSCESFIFSSWFYIFFVYLFVHLPHLFTNQTFLLFWFFVFSHSGIWIGADENECKYRPCDVFAHCTNTMGSYYCSCFPGYEGDGFSCKGKFVLSTFSFFLSLCLTFYLLFLLPGRYEFDLVSVFVCLRWNLFCVTICAHPSREVHKFCFTIKQSWGGEKCMWKGKGKVRKEATIAATTSPSTSNMKGLSSSTFYLLQPSSLSSSSSSSLHVINFKHCSSSFSFASSAFSIILTPLSLFELCTKTKRKIHTSRGRKGQNLMSYVSVRSIFQWIITLQGGWESKSEREGKI